MEQKYKKETKKNIFVMLWWWYCRTEGQDGRIAAIVSARTRQ